MFRGALNDSAVVHLTSSSQLHDDGVSLTAAVTPHTSVEHWSLLEVQQHVFFLTWVCGIPVHVRYVVQLLQRSAVKLSSGTAAANADGTSVAQREVLLPVFERGKRVQAALRAWPPSHVFTPEPSTMVFLVSLGIAEVTATTTSSSEKAEEVPGKIEPLQAPTDTADSTAKRIAVCQNHETASENCERVEANVCSPPSSSSFAIQAVAVEPDASFANVTALALYSAAEADSPNTADHNSTSTSPQRASITLPTFPIPVSAAWCSRAYWTAVSQARQWAELPPPSTTPQKAPNHHNSSNTNNSNKMNDSNVVSGTGEATSRPTSSFFYPSRTLRPASTAPLAPVAQERKRRRNGGAPSSSSSSAAAAAEAVVIVDGEDDGDDDAKPPPAEPAVMTLLAVPGGGEKAGKNGGKPAHSAKAEEEVIVIDSDDD